MGRDRRPHILIQHLIANTSAGLQKVLTNKNAFLKHCQGIQNNVAFYHGFNGFYWGGLGRAGPFRDML